ncbi:MAG: VWA domain-containing protein [Pirellulales bacterium]
MSRRLPGWLADWLGLPVPQGGDGATWQLDSAWTWAPWVTLLVVMLATVWTVVLYRREQTAAGRFFRSLLVALRLTAIATLLVMLAQWALAIRLTGPPPIAIVIDRSASMNIADRYDDPAIDARLAERLKSSGLDEPTRLNIVKLLATEADGRLLAELADRYRLNVYFAADGIERLPNADSAELARTIHGLKAEGAESQSTRLGDAVRHVLADLRGNPPAAIVLLSDGVTTAGVPLAEAVQDARRAGVRLVAVGLGNDKPPHDIELADVLVDEAVFVGDLVSFQLQIKASGLEGQSARVVLRSGDESNGETLAEQAITLPPTGQTLSLHLVDRPSTPGDVAYVVEVQPRNEEANRDNNRQRRAVAVRDTKIRVLLAQGYPNYEFRFLKTLLDRDPTIELATYLQDADPDYTEQDKSAVRSFPASRDELFAYDVLILGDVDPRLLTRSVWPLVRAFVAEKGGGLAFVAGPRYMPWLYRDNADVAALLPVDLSALDRTVDNRQGEISRGFTVRPTPIGLQSPPMQLGDKAAQTADIWQQLAPHYWLAEFDRLKPAAQVLAHTSSLPSNGNPQSEFRNPPSKFPLICFQYFGAGRVLLHAIDSTWLWRRGVGDAFFARYWVQTIRYLARSKLTSGRGAQLTTDRREYRRGEAVQLRARFLDPRQAPTADAVTVSIDAAGRARQKLVLRRNPAVGGVFEGSLADLPEGSYQALLADPQAAGNPPEARFTVLAPPGELARPQMDRAALAAAAEATHGKFYTLADADRLLAELPAGRRVPIENLPPIPIWNRWWLLSAFLLCISGEWILRKRAGML